VTGISLYQKLYGGSKDDNVYAMVVTSDSGQVVAGKTNSTGGGGYDGLVMKIIKGAVIWSKVFGGANEDDFTDVKRQVMAAILFVVQPDHMAIRQVKPGW
jgi:hypothetical protein